MASRVDLIVKQFDKDTTETEFDQAEASRKDPFNKAMYNIASAAEGGRLGHELGEFGVTMAKGIGKMKEKKAGRQAKRISKKLEKGKIPQALKRIDRAVTKGANPDDLVELLSKSVTNYQITGDGETVQVVGLSPVTEKLRGIVESSKVVSYQQGTLVPPTTSPGTTAVKPNAGEDTIVDNEDYNPLFDPKYYAKPDEPRTEQEKLSDVKPDDDSKFKIWGSKRS